MNDVKFMIDMHTAELRKLEAVARGFQQWAAMRMLNDTEAFDNTVMGLDLICDVIKRLREEAEDIENAAYDAFATVSETGTP